MISETLSENILKKDQIWCLNLHLIYCSIFADRGSMRGGRGYKICLFFCGRQKWWPLSKATVLSHWKLFKNEYTTVLIHFPIFPKCNGVGLNLSCIILKMAKHSFKILRREHCKVFKVCLTISQHYAWMS